jgi:pimeloyl-ACP methyl ester carboxylesterase
MARDELNRYLVKRLVFLGLILSLSFLDSLGQEPVPSKVTVNGVELHYIEAGTGDTVILLHGGTGDYRSLPGPFQTLSEKYHVVSYSRRYHFPNNNPIVKVTSGYGVAGRPAVGVNNFSALSEAEDLAGLIQTLKLGRVHLVGTSYGAYTALALALKRPEMVRSMVLTEPPIHSWMKGTEGYKEFMTKIWDPCRKNFKKGDKNAAMRAFVNGLFGPGYFERLPQAVSSAIMDNARAMEALALSSDPFPYLPKEKVKNLQIPTLLMTGANTVAVHKAVDEELARLLPNATAITVPNAGHGIARDNPTVFMTNLVEFLAKQK